MAAQPPRARRAPSLPPGDGRLYGAWVHCPTIALPPPVLSANNLECVVLTVRGEWPEVGYLTCGRAGGANASPTAWENFYVIIGGAAAALTGLMFVVITLVAGLRSRSTDGVSAFSTPTVVHFAAALLIAALLSAPWTALAQIVVALGLSIGGLIYVGIVTRRLLRVAAYRPVLEDWLGHAIALFVAYAALLVAAILLPSNATPALFLVAAVTVLLVFDGIHNAWDIVTDLALELVPSQDNEKKDERE